MDEEPGSLGRTDERARIQTFLIADVRGYTLFTQERGDEAAAKLAAKFAEIAREIVQARGGNVIELRGDEALAAFSSARQAVVAAVDLQDRFVDETFDDPELPLPVGIGLDAGEAVPVEEGYRGGALNLAARLCGRARPGEILASRSVTHLARRVDGVRYIDRGRVQLKNLSEPVEFVQIVPEGIDPAQRLRATLAPPARMSRRSRVRIAIAIAAAIAIASGATITLLLHGGEPTIAAGSVGFLTLSGNLKGTVSVGERPGGVAQGAGSLWVTEQESGKLLQVDPTTFRVEDRYTVGAGPSGVAVADGLVWVANADERTISVIDPKTHDVLPPVVVGNGPAAIVADGDRIWVANSVDATVSEIDATDASVVHTWPVGERPVALAVGAGAVWVANASDGTVSRVVSGQGQTGRPIPVGRGPAALAFGSESLWVANAEDGTVMKVDPATGSVTGSKRVGEDPVALASTSDGIWVVSAREGTVLKLDPETERVTHIYQVGNEPRALTATGAGLWVGVEASPAAHRGGTLRIVTKEVGSIDPHSGNFTAAWLSSIYDGLVTFRRTGGAAGTTVVPDLAASLPIPTDAGLTYAFTLRDGIRFSNGHVVTPRDVVATFERVLVGKKYGHFLLPDLVGGSTCTPKDPRACDLSRGVVADGAAGTVTFHLARRAPDFLKILATRYFSIVPADTPIHLDGRPIPATGPYEIGEVGGDGSLVLERNPLFREWSADAQPEGFADRIEVISGVDPDQQVAMIERGEADIGLDGVPPDRLQALQREASGRLVRSQFLAIGTVALNTTSYPFDHLDARRAVAFALERGALNRAWLHTAEIVAREGVLVAEESQVTCQLLPPNIPGYAPYCPFTGPGAAASGQWAEPAVSRATQLVQRSGTAGAEVTIAMSPCLGPTARQVATTLRDIGYRVVMRTDGPLRPAAIDCWFAALSPDADVSYAAWAQDYPSAASFLVPLLSCVQPDGTPAVKGAGGFSDNSSNFCNHAIDRRMQRALDLQLIDPHASARAFEALDRDLVDLAPMIPYQTGSDTWLFSKRTGNVEVSPEFGPIVSQVWVR